MASTFLFWKPLRYEEKLSAQKMKSQGVKELIIVNELSQILKFVNIIIALHANVQLVNVIYNVKI